MLAFRKRLALIVKEEYHRKDDSSSVEIIRSIYNTKGEDKNE